MCLIDFNYDTPKQPPCAVVAGPLSGSRSSNVWLLVWRLAAFATRPGLPLDIN